MTPTRSDRTVHADFPGWEIVRYDRAGKWYLEPTPDQRLASARQLTIREAVWLASTHHDASVHFGRAGGSRFDSLVRKARSS